MQTEFGFGKTVDMSFDEAVDRVTSRLSDEGFGVLTEIDVAQTMKKKLGEEMPPYRILGACNPQLAHQAISMMPEIGLLLPCNVVVREDGEGAVHVSFLDPEAMLGLAGADELGPFASEVSERLQRVMQAL